MKSLIFIGGPIIATIGFGFYSGLLSFVETHPGLEHQAGVQPGGTFLMQYEETYQCDENGDNCVLVDTTTEVEQIDGLEFEARTGATVATEPARPSTDLGEPLELEFEEEPIEYRNGSEPMIVTKQPGLFKYTNIQVRRPSGFDWSNFKFVFDAQVKRDACTDCNEVNPAVENYDPTDLNSNQGGEMFQIDPPQVSFPAGQG